MFGTWAERQAFTNPAQAHTVCGSYDGSRLFISCQDVGQGFDFFESSDFGATWISTVNTNSYIKACGSNADRRIYFSTSNTLEYTLDNGVTFSTLMMNAQSNQSPGVNQDIAVSFSLSTIYYLQSSSVYATRDMGVTWNPLSNLGYFSTTLSVACSSNGQYVGFIGDPEGADSGFGNTLYSSSDYGSNWVSLSSSNPGKPIYLTSRQALQSVSISGDGSSIFAGAFQGQLNTSRDYGSTFTTHTFTSTINVNNFTASAINSNGEVILAGANNIDSGFSYVVQSLDGGSTWSIGIESNENWANTFLSQDGNVRAAAGSNVEFLYVFGSLTSNFSSFDLATSLIEVQPSWSYKMTLPPVTGYENKSITFVKNSPHMVQFMSQESTIIHTLSNTFVQLIAGPSNWLVMGNDSGFTSNSYSINNTFITSYRNQPYFYVGNVQNPQVITDLAVFPGVLSNYQASFIVNFSNVSSIQTSSLITSTFSFLNDITSTLTISSTSLLYSDTDYSQNVAGEILQTFTA